jgi:WD40 repeat protein
MRIYISYRRADTAAVAGRLADRLTAEFGPAGVFLDVSLEAGSSFTAGIERAIRESDALLVLIGPGWLSTTDGAGRPRLHDPDDFVALEIGVALDSGILIIPLLVDSADMPRRSDLPSRLRGLADRQAFRLDHDTFSAAVDQLIVLLRGRSTAGGRAAAEAAPSARPGVVHDRLVHARSMIVDTSGVQSVAYTPDGERVVSGGGDGSVQVHDVATGLSGGPPLVGHQGTVWSVATSPDGGLAVSAGEDGTVRRWDLAGGAEFGAALTGHAGAVRSVALFAEVARVISAGDDNVIRIWDLGTGAEIGSPLEGHKEAVRSVAVAPDGTRLISGSYDGTARVWDLGAEAGNRTLGSGMSAVMAVAISPDGGRAVAGYEDGSVRIWELGTGRPLGGPFAAHEDRVLTLAFSADGTRLATAGDDEVLRLWDVANGLPVGEPLVGAHRSVRSVAVRPDGRQLVSAGWDGSVRVWELPAGAEPGGVLAGGLGPVSSVSTSRVGERAVSCGTDGVIRAWELAVRAPIGQPVVTSAPGQAVLTPDGERIVSSGADGRVHLWDAATGIESGAPSITHDGTSAQATTPDGARLVAGGPDGTVWIWDLVSGTEIARSRSGHRGDVLSIAVAPDGSRAITGSADATVRMWDTASGAEVGQPLLGHDGPVRAVAVTPDGARIVSGGEDGTLRIWNAQTGAEEGPAVRGHAGGVLSVAVAPDGSWAVSGGHDGAARVWDLAGGVEAAPAMTGHRKAVRSVAVTADGTRVLSGGDDGTLRIWSPFGPARESHDAAVTSDAESTEDRLGITTDVRTVAALLAATATRPPLSIAVMGNWGSGKSTFMRLVIDEVTGLTRMPLPGAPYVRHIRQVRFNAWHYSDEHLWVGLIEHLFREIRPHRAADRAAPDAAATIEGLEAELAGRKADHARLEAELKEIDELDPQRGWFGWLGQIRRAALVSRAAGTDAFNQVRRRSIGWSTLFAALAVAAVVVGVRFGDQLREWAALPWLVTAAGAVAALVAPVKQVWKSAADLTGTARSRLIATRGERAKEIKELEDELTRLDPARRLDALLTEISATDRYATYRGLVGRISDDLQRLDRQLVDVHRADPAEQWRIVLYIDDLDRCPAGRVVEVLQAVNLLMSMELFFVVVAVDPRWLFAALDQHHRHLLAPAAPPGDTDHEHADRRDEALSGRALDYLDKIFQIPYALPPLGRHGRSYLRSLLPDVEVEPEPVGVAPSAGQREPDDIASTGAAPRPRRESRGQAPHTDRPAADAPDHSGSAPAAGPGPAAAPATRTRRSAPISVRNLRLTRAEADFLPRLADLLATPRAVKKFTNLYRLLRIGVPTDQLPGFLGTAEAGGPYQAAALMLAMLISQPGRAGELHRCVAAGLPDDDIAEVLHSVRTRNNLTGGKDLALFIDRLRADGIAVHASTGTYQRWMRTVARYSFETYSLLGDSTDPC